MEQGAMQYRPAKAPAAPRRLWLGSDIFNDLIEVVDDTHDDDSATALPMPWRVLIADDDRSVHEATVAALAGQRIHDRPLAFLHAYSARETVSLLAACADVHLLLLDVVMESPEAGLQDLKIIVRTGQPGLASEQDIRHRYAIDGYANKAALTRNMLRDVIASALLPDETNHAGGKQ